MIVFINWSKIIGVSYYRLKISKQYMFIIKYKYNYAIYEIVHHFT